MASYTEADIEAAGKFADANYNIRLIRALHAKAPHLTSWLDVTVRSATHDDYYIPSTLSTKSYVTTVKMTEKLCKLLSCDPTNTKDVCKSNEEASYFYVGDDGYAAQCQPACFGMTSKITYDDEGNEEPQMPMLFWHMNNCVVANAPMINWLEKTRWRSNTLYETRNNDMPTGFSRTPSNLPFGTGVSHKMNATYCRYFDRTFKDGTCKMEWWELILDAIIGMSLINTIRSAIRVLTNGGVPFPLPNLPPLPSTLEPQLTKDGWKKNTNSNFVVPEVLDTLPDSFAMRREFREDEEFHQDAKVNRLIHERRRAEYDAPVSAFMKVQHGRNDDEDDSDEEDANGDDYEGADFWDGLFQAIFSLDFMAMIAIDIAFEKIKKQIKKFAKKLIEKFSSEIGEGVLKSIKKIGSKVLKSGFKSLSMKMVKGVAVKIGSKLMVAIGKMLTAAASVVGYLLIGAQLLDLLFSFWDPFGYGNMFPPELPPDCAANGERAIRQAMESAQGVYEWENLAGTLLSKDEIFTLLLESLMDRLYYLDALVVNSEGSRIDKGSTLNFDGVSKNEVTRQKSKFIAKQYRFDETVFHEYNQSFMTRVEISRNINKLSWGLLGLSAFCFVCSLTGLCILFVILALVCFAAGNIALYSHFAVMPQFNPEGGSYGNYDWD